MELDGEDLDNIFEEYENTDNATRADDTENAQTPVEPGIRVPVPKRIAKNPRLKFNPERLCGERGIPVLVDHFKNVKFKGAGHEKEDLDKLLSKLEHWTHRLFPSMKFEDCLHHIEKLGKKRPVQTCIRKMRLNMPILSKDFVNEEEDNVLRNDDPEPVEMDAFDRLLEESEDVINTDVPTTENIMDSNPFDSSPVQNSYGPGQVLGSAQTGLTDEQRERIERNKMLAIERRKARLAAVQDNSSHSQSSTSELFFSQNASKQQDKTSASSSRNDIEIKEIISSRNENISVPVDDSIVEFSNNNDSLKDNFGLSDQNTDGLGLDDLVDLVDDEETVSNQNNQENESSIECGNSNYSEGAKDDVSDLRHQNTENLRLNNLIDSVDEEESEKVSVATSEKPVCIDKVEEDNSKTDFAYSQQNVDANTPDITDIEMTVPDETSKCGDVDNLEIESLLDLVDENSVDN